LGKRKDFQNFLVANFVDGDYMWVGDLVNNNESEKVYRNWLSRQESISYAFSEDLSKMDDNFNVNMLVEDGQHPKLLKMLMRNEVSPETVVILNDLTKFFDYWSRNIDETVIWPPIRTKLMKYKPFVKYDEAKLKKLVVQRFG